METPPEANKVSKLEALSDEIRTRRGELGSARKINGASAAVPQTAESKLQVYRNRSQLLRAYNRSTERVLVANGTGSAVESADGTPTSVISSTPDLRMESGVYSSRGDSTVIRLTKQNRTLMARVKILEEEIERYKQDLKKMVVDVDGISEVSVATDQNVVLLMDDLQTERSNHQNARNSLEVRTRQVDDIRRDLAEKTSHVEQKDLELQDQAERLAVLEDESRDAHRKNLELTAKIEEVLAAQEESSAARAQDALRAEQAVKEAGRLDEDAAAEREALLKKLRQAEARIELTSGRLEAINARAEKIGRENQDLKRAAAGMGSLRQTLRGLWSFIVAVGWAGFLGLIFVLVSEDALRPRGVDVYRYAT